MVINVVNHCMVEQMSLSSTAYDKGVNEFIKAGFTEVASETVKPPRVGEAPVAFECSVEEVIELAQSPGAGNLILAKVKRIHINDEYLTNDVLDTEKLDLVGRMGGSWYVHANGNALFEIPKPIRNKGIGVDALPKGVRESKVLTGNNLGRLGNLEQLPSKDEINKSLQDLELGGLSKIEMHKMAQKLLEEEKTEKAMALLMLAENA